VLLEVNFSENLANLALRHAATEKTASQSFALDFLITQQSQYLRMKVAITVAGYTKLLHTALTITMTLTKTIALIIRIVD
jgi:hypothetical protein